MIQRVKSYTMNYLSFFLFGIIYYAAANKTELSKNNTKHRPISTNKIECTDDSFVWCLPWNYNKIQTPWKDLKFDNSVFPWIYYFDFSIKEIQEIHDDRQTITMSLHWYLTWLEPRLQINGSSPEWESDRVGDFGVITTDPGVLDDIWQPDLYISQLRQYKTSKALSDLSGLHIYKDKYISYEATALIKFGCLMSFDDYPLDSQECPFIVGSYNYQKNTVDCNSTYYVEKRYQRTLQYLLEIRDLSAEEINAIDDDFAAGGFMIVLQRSRLQILFQTYLTSAMFVFVSWVTFMIKPEVVPTRMGLLVTIFLVLINIFNGVKSEAPVSKTLNAVDRYLLICIGLVFMALFEYTIVLTLDDDDSGDHEKATASRQRKGRVKILSLRGKMEMDQNGNGSKTRCSSKRRRDLRRRLDSFSIVVFPGIFLIFNIIYWTAYL